MELAKLEVLRYLGYRAQDISGEIHSLIDDCMAECRQASKPHFIWKLFDVRVKGEEISLEGTSLVLRGRNIYRHLRSCEKAAVLAATLGVGVDQLIRRWEYADLTRSVILDACATQLIEEVCDAAEEQIKREAEERGHITNFRYSPGYGDLDLAIQPEILSVLDTAKKIGLTCTQSLILLPRKSVTAFIGLSMQGENMVAERGGCDTCNSRQNCQYRKGGADGGCTGTYQP